MEEEERTSLTAAAIAAAETSTGTCMSSYVILQVIEMIVITDVHSYSDTIGTGPKCHYRQASL